LQVCEASERSSIPNEDYGPSSEDEACHQCSDHDSDDSSSNFDENDSNTIPKRVDPTAKISFDVE
jgi:hypothetical protein